jgi:hypothetical protein
MPDADQVYFRRRAEEELARARNTSDEQLQRFHHRLAGLYFGLASSGSEESPHSMRP